MSGVTHSIPNNAGFTAELVACSKTGIYATAENSKYRVILKKVSFGILITIMVSKEEKNFSIESKDKGLYLSKLS